MQPPKIRDIGSVSLLRKASSSAIKQKLHFYFLIGAIFGVGYAIVGVLTVPEGVLTNQDGTELSTTGLTTDHVALILFVVLYFSLTGLALGLIRTRAKYSALGWLLGCACGPFVLLSSDPGWRNFFGPFAVALLSSITFIIFGIVIDINGGKFNTYVSGRKKLQSETGKKSELFWFFTTGGPYRKKLVFGKSFWISLLTALFLSPKTRDGELDYNWRLFCFLLVLILGYFKLPYIQKQQLLRERFELLKKCDAEFKALQEEIEKEWLEITVNEAKAFIRRLSALEKKWQEKATEQRTKTKAKYENIVRETELQLKSLFTPQFISPSTTEKGATKTQLSETEALKNFFSARVEVPAVDGDDEPEGEILARRRFDIADLEGKIAEATKIRAIQTKKRSERIRLGATKVRIPKDADDFEEVCAEWMRKTGYPSAKRTPKGPDGGIDVTAKDAVAQAKMYGNKKVTAEEVRALIGSKVQMKKKKALFFTYGPGYTPESVRIARQTQVLLYQLDVDGLKFRKI